MAEMNNEHHCAFVKAGTRSGFRISFGKAATNTVTNDSKTLLAQFPQARSVHCGFPFFVYFFGGLECVGHSFAYVAHL
jgi:hypothetical protein